LGHVRPSIEFDCCILIKNILFCTEIKCPE